VVEEVVATRETVTWYSTLAVSEVAQVWPGTVAVHAMCFAFVAEKACSRGKLNTNTCLLVAAEWLEVRVDVLAIDCVRPLPLVFILGTTYS
jgi:hypothetical protein